MRVIALISGLVAIPLVMTAQTSPLRFTATTGYVSGAGEAIRIDLTNWSTDADRDQMADAWNMTVPAAAAPAAGDAGRGGRGGGRGGRGGGRGGRGGDGAGRGGDGAAALPADPDAVDAANPDDPAFRFGRGGARGAVAAAPTSPQASLATALKKEPTVGILWTSEIVGYSIKYAYRATQADGGERIILATDRRVGAWSNLWKLPESASATDYAFSVIELRVNSKGEGEGKISMTGKLAVDSNTKAIALEGYNALPVILKGVKRQ